MPHRRDSKKPSGRGQIDLYLAYVRFGSKADIATAPTNVRFTPESGHWNSLASCPLCTKSGHSSLTGVPFINLLICGTCWPDLWRAHRLRHAVEDHDALAAAARRERVSSVFVATVDVLPVVRHPDIARRAD